jgi:hypothetical protein
MFCDSIRFGSVRLTGIFVTCLVYWKVSALVEATVWFLEYVSGLVRQCLD